MTAEARAPKEVLKVAATSKPVLVAGAIAGVIRLVRGADLAAHFRALPESKQPSAWTTAIAGSRHSIDWAS